MHSNFYLPAFILFRQHLQSSVVAENPGLPNPDISKIIGKIWKGLPLKEQEPWKKHADVSLTTPSLILFYFILWVPCLYSRAGREGKALAEIPWLPVSATTAWSQEKKHKYCRTYGKSRRLWHVYLQSMWRETNETPFNPVDSFYSELQ